MKPKKGDIVTDLTHRKGVIKKVSKGYVYIDFKVPGYFEPYPIHFMEQLKPKLWRLTC